MFQFDARIGITDDYCTWNEITRSFSSRCATSFSSFSIVYASSFFPFSENEFGEFSILFLPSSATTVHILTFVLIHKDIRIQYRKCWPKQISFETDEMRRIVFFSFISSVRCFWLGRAKMNEFISIAHCPIIKAMWCDDVMLCGDCGDTLVNNANGKYKLESFNSPLFNWTIQQRSAVFLHRKC